MKIDWNDLWSGKYAKWLVMAGLGLFSLLILIEISRFFKQDPFFTADYEQSAPLVTPPKKSESAALHASLFGDYLSPDLNESDVKQSMLDLKLVGIMFNGKINESEVIIRSSGGEEKNYRVGDTVPGGAVIKRILTDGVLLEYQGALERLDLSKKKLRFEPPARPLIEE